MHVANNLQDRKLNKIDLQDRKLKKKKMTLKHLSTNILDG